MNITIFRLQVVSKGGVFVTSLDFYLSSSFSPFLFSFSFLLFLAFLYFYLIFILVFFEFLLCFCIFVAFLRFKIFFGFVVAIFILFCLFLFIIFEIAFPISEIKPQNSHDIERTDLCIGRMVHFVG